MSNTPVVGASVVITTHQNADLDALAAMVGASYLYPGAVLINPGVLLRKQRNTFIDNITSEFGFKQAKDCDLGSVTTLVVVDTRQRSRIPHLESVLSNPGLEVHLYDHHPDSPDDLTATHSVVKPYGSCTALIVELLKENGVELEVEAATLLGLGLYEDTGSFNFSSTAEQDFLAGAWLKTQGMDLGVVSSATSSNLDREQLSTLNALLQSAQSHHIKGVQVVVAEVVLEDYLDDFATLAQKMLEIEKIKVLFALGQMGDKIQMVGRSSLSEVDVGAVCKEFGGGGHSYAASASISLKTLPEVQERLLRVLLKHVKSKSAIFSLMSTPVISLDIKSDLGMAEEFMGRYGLKAAPVVDYAKDMLKPLGIIEYQTTVRAKAHKLSHLLVEEYMQRKIFTVDPDDDLDAALNIVINQRQRLVPVMENGFMVGVITRTDLINTLVEEPESRSAHDLHDTHHEQSNRERDLSGNLRDRLPKKLVSLLQLAGQLGDQLGFPVYAVGGFVRDLLMSTPNHDIDLSVEGDGILFAKALAERLKGKVKVHAKFKTAVVTYPDPDNNDNGHGVGESKLDIATSRLEYYESPAALPTVEHSSIRMDLYRRDFTINAVALELNKAHFGKLIDFYGAQRDIKGKLIRVIHSLSFIEDPTRIIRAIRFEIRFGFRIGAHTDRLIRNAIQLGLVEKLSGHRIFNEFKLLCEEKDTLSCLKRMESFNLLRIIDPVLQLTKNKEEIIAELSQLQQGYKMFYLNPKQLESWPVYLLGLVHGAKYPEVSDMLQRLSLSLKVRENFLQLREQARIAKSRLRTWKTPSTRPDQNKEHITVPDEQNKTQTDVALPVERSQEAVSRPVNGSMSKLCHILSKLPVDAIIYLIAQEKDEQKRQSISYYLTTVRNEKADIDGNDLQKLGMKPGTGMRKVLGAVLDAKIDGKVRSREEQLTLARKLIKNDNAAASSPV